MRPDWFHSVSFHSRFYNYPYCEKYNQHVKLVNARGSGGFPQEVFENRCSEIEFGSIFSNHFYFNCENSTISAMLFSANTSP